MESGRSWVANLNGFMRYGFRTLLSQKRPIKFGASVFLMKTGLSRAFRISHNGYRLRFFPTALSAMLWTYPDYEHLGEERMIARYLGPGESAIDIGANIGTTAITAARAVGITGRIYAFEAHPRIFSFLKENVAINQLPQVEVFNYALGEMQGTLRFSDRRVDDTTNQVELEEKGRQTIQVQCMKLDDVLPNDRRYSLLKIDVEGFELPVLKGAVRTLTQVETVLIEVWNEHAIRYGYTIRDLLTFLCDQGFALFKVSKDGELLDIGADYFAGDCQNIFATRDAGSLRNRLRRQGFAHG